MHFFTAQAGLAAAIMAAGATALAMPQDFAIVTDTEVVSVTELVYVNPAGQTLSEAAETAATVVATIVNSPAPAAPTSTSPAVVVQTPSPSAVVQATPAVPDKNAAQATTLQTYVTPSPTPESYSTAAASTPTSASGSAPSGCADPSAFFSAAQSLCGGADDVNYCVGALGAHNLHRANHSASPLVWNNTLATWAKSHTDQCYFSDYLKDDGTLHQSNAFASEGDCAGDGKAATESWYNEEILFNSLNLWGEESPTVDTSLGEVGHFANVVWQSFTSIGCATTVCPTLNFPSGSPYTNANLTLCFYSVYTANNDYATNVFKPIGCPTYEQA